MRGCLYAPFCLPLAANVAANVVAYVAANVAANVAAKALLDSFFTGTWAIAMALKDSCKQESCSSRECARSPS